MLNNISYLSEKLIVFQNITMKTKTFLLSALIFCSCVSAQVGINTSTPTKTLDVNGSLRVRDLSNPDKMIVAADTQGELTLISPSEILSPKAILNNSSSAAEQRAVIYEGKCFQPADNSSSCTVSINHYTSCTNFETPIHTQIIVGQEILSGNGNFSGIWRANYIDNKGYINTTPILNQVPPSYPIIHHPSPNLARYQGSGDFAGQCTADLVTTITPATGNVKIESVKRSMYSHLVYLLSVARSRSL